MKRTKNKIVQPPQFNVLTNDPSLRAWGWAVITANGKIVEVGCIKTESENKKRRIRKGDDSVRRVSELVLRLKDIIETYDVKMILSELPHGSQNAAAATMVGIVAGIAQTMSDLLDIPIEWYSEADSKKAVLHKKGVTKTDMIVAIDKLYKVPWTGTKYIDEAVADAIAIYYVAKQQSATLKMLRR